MRFDAWTFVLQTVNFLILAWLLHRFLYQPVLRVVAARRAESDRLLAEAEAGKRKAEALEAELRTRRDAMDAERDALLAAARKAAQAETAATLDRARDQAARLLREAEEKARRQAEAAEAEERHQAARLAAAMAARLVAATPPPPEAFRARLDAALSDLPEPTRVALRDGPLEVVTAAPLAPAAEAELRRWIGARLAPATAAQFHVDAALLAGIELRTPHAVLRGSWAADLERLAAETLHDDAAG